MEGDELIGVTAVLNLNQLVYDWKIKRGEHGLNLAKRKRASELKKNLTLDLFILNVTLCMPSSSLM